VQIRKFMCTGAGVCVGIGLLLVATGCSSGPPIGNSSGRVDVYTDAGEARRSAEVGTVALIEFADRVAEALAERVPTIPEIAGKDYRVVLAMGNITNDTRSRSGDFLMIRRRMFIAMVNNRQIANTAKMIEDQQRLGDLMRGFVDEASVDVLDENLSTGGGGREIGRASCRERV